MVIFPYKNYSKGYRELLKAFGISRLANRQVFCSVEALSKVSALINWGSSSGYAKEIATYVKGTIINHPKKLDKASNKSLFFKAMKKAEVRIPDITESVEEAINWLQEGHEVLGRKRRGSGGMDVTFGTEDSGEFLKADFWSKYQKKKHEYRIHIGGGEVFDYQRKALRKTDDNGDAIDTAEVDFRVRNHRSGFIFKRIGVTPPDDVLNQSLAAVKALDLDFGAVDCIWNEHQQKAYVLEINTAPGLEGETIEKYKKMLEGLIKCA